jgi:preprotein translocase subunit SecA
MTGTALTEAEEFSTIYELECVEMPTNLDYQASRPEMDLQTYQDKDEEGYPFTYYALGSDPNKQPLYWKRKDYRTWFTAQKKASCGAITLEILQFHVIGAPSW